MSLIERYLRPFRIEDLEVVAATVAQEDKRRGTCHKRILLWAILGPELAKTLTGRPLQEPTYAELEDLRDRLKRKEHRYSSLGEHLLFYAPKTTMISLKALASYPGEWSHPCQVLTQPRPSNAELWERFCKEKEAGATSRRFLAIGDRLRRAAEIDRNAAQRRQERLEKKRDCEVIPGHKATIFRWFLGHFPQEGMTRERVLKALRAVGISPTGVDKVIEFLELKRNSAGVLQVVRTTETQARWRLAEFFSENARARISFLAEVAVEYRSVFGVNRDIFIEACGLFLEAEAARNPQKLGRLCWDAACAK